jgi:hypothetical protein
MGFEEETIQAVAALPRMTTGQLAELYLDLFGDETRSRNRRYLIRRLAFALQARDEGSLSDRAARRIDELMALAPPARPIPRGRVRPISPRRDPRLPSPGTLLRRIYRGQQHTVEVVSDGFLYEGTVYRSLSRIAREITGTRWNGFAFFGLAKVPRK